jgi:ABC-type protease/lipase transport system fused ATPase/permease subunit
VAKPAKSELRIALDRCRGPLFAAMGFSFFINILLLISPLYMMQVYDRVLTSRSENTLWLLTLIAVALLLMMGLL